MKKVRTSESGQTLVLVAAGLFTLVAMAALAIDLTALYEARTEMQRAADAAALAGAKAFVESGVTTNPADTNLQALATLIGDSYINQLLAQNEVGSVAPTLAVPTTRDYLTNPGNPTITVKLHRTDVPTFFAHIFGRRLATVSATAVAEAYNSSLPPGSAATGMPPVGPKCVKPWLIPNVDPGSPTLQAFINETTGALNRPAVYPNGVIGEKIVLRSACGVGGIGCGASLPVLITDLANHTTSVLQYFPAKLAISTNATCPSCAGGTPYEQSAACCDQSNAQQYACGSAGPGLLLNLAGGLVANTVDSVECAIGATAEGAGNGQDEIGLGTGAQPPADAFGNFLADNGNDPILIRTHSGPLSGNYVNTSRSIVTVPIFKTGGLAGLLSVLTVQVEGYMQAFVEQTSGGATNGEIDLYVLNISGCGPNVDLAKPPVSGGGVSPVPVRLIR